MIRYRNYILSLLLVGILLPLQGQSFKSKGNSDAERFMEKGKEAYFDREYDRAISYFEEVAQINEYYDELYEYRGNCFAQLREYRQAELDYKVALDQLPKPDRGSSRRVGDEYILLDPGGEEGLNQRYARVYNNLGVVLFRMGRRTAAYKAFDMALEYDPDSDVAKQNERGASLNRGDRLVIEDESTVNKRTRRNDQNRGYENEFNQRPVSLWKPKGDDADDMMAEIREAREELVAMEEDEDYVEKNKGALSFLGPKEFVSRKVPRRGKTYRKPTYLGASQNYLSIDKIRIKGKSTYVTIKIKNEKSKSFWVCLAPKSSSEAPRIVGRTGTRHRSYRLKGVEGMAYYPNTSELRPNSTKTFVLEFEKIADNIGFINIVEGKNQRESAWNFYQIDLR